MSNSKQATGIELWGVFETTAAGPNVGNPFVDVSFGARFQHRHRVVDVAGFYDGDGTYRVRFSPDSVGEWSYETYGSAAEIAGQTGSFECVQPKVGNHGPISRRNAYHFGYADGTPFRQVGTTCYAWAHQGDALEEQTLRTLAESPFNKLRMCVFPKHYEYNANEPVYYPYERTASGTWDFARFDPAFWRHFEKRVGQLCDLGVEADIILFHPYDRWGFDKMDAAADDRYLAYAVARLAAYRNVWWSFANEYDLMPSKTLADWERFARIVQESDPYQHPRSIHNCRAFYDHSRPWITHLSVQRSTVEETRQWRNDYRKPVVVDECCYEGDIPQWWGDITAEEMVRRFWETTVRGGYCGHGETYLDANDVLWWSKGGTLHGQSPSRLAFLRRVLDEGPATGLDPIDGFIHHDFAAAGLAGEYYLTYFGVHQPALARLRVPDDRQFAVDVLDTWAMTVDALPGSFSGEFTVKLPARPFCAVRARGL